jgi:glycerol uptake facilitator-like aquaporin
MSHRAAFAEGLGSLLLTSAVVGSGVMAQQLTSDSAVALLANTFATAAALAVLIAILAPVSGAHFNPAVTLVALWQGKLSRSNAASYVLAQVIGCCLGAAVAHAMFDLPLLQISMHARNGLGQLLSEVIATAGLITVVLSCRNASEAAWRVPAWIGAAYWFTASTSFANPAITLGRALSDTFSGIAVQDIPGFITAQFGGAVCGMLVVHILRLSKKPV